MRSRLNCIVLCDYCVHSYTVWYLLFPRWLHLTKSRFLFAADRLSFLIVCRFLLPLIVCRSRSFAVSFSPLIVCRSWSFAVSFWRWSFVVPDPYFLLPIVCHILSLADPCFSGDRLSYSFFDWSVFLWWSFVIFHVGWSVFLCRSFAIFLSWLISVFSLVVCHIPRWLIRISLPIGCHIS